jgi:hypothetical protein
MRALRIVYLSLSLLAVAHGLSVSSAKELKWLNALMPWGLVLAGPIGWLWFWAMTWRYNWPSLVAFCLFTLLIDRSIAASLRRGRRTFVLLGVATWLLAGGLLTALGYS